MSGGSAGSGPQSESSVTVGRGARLRSGLDPTAWVVLEELWLQAEPTGGAWTAAASARSLALDLGLNPATTAKALRRLRDAGLATLARGAGSAGRFGLSAYRLTTDHGISRAWASRRADNPSVETTNVTSPCVMEPDPGRPTTAQPYAATPSTRRRQRPRPAGGDADSSTPNLFASLALDGPFATTTPGAGP